MSKNHPNELLSYVKSVNRSRQDICINVLAYIFWNQKYYIKFLATDLYYGNKDNYFKDSLFVILKSTKFIATTRAMCILMVAASQPMRYLAQCSITFGSYRWSNRHMSKQFDVLEEHLLYLVDHPNNLFDRYFILNILVKLENNFLLLISF